MIIRACRGRQVVRDRDRAPASGYIIDVDPMGVAHAALLLGAGRMQRRRRG